MAFRSKMQFDRIQSVIEAATVQTETGKRSPLWWVLPGSLAGMPMPFILPERRLKMGGPLGAYEDEIPVLYTARFSLDRGDCSPPWTRSLRA